MGDSKDKDKVGQIVASPHLVRVVWLMKRYSSGANTSSDGVSKSKWGNMTVELRPAGVLADGYLSDVFNAGVDEGTLGLGI